MKFKNITRTVMTSTLALVVGMVTLPVTGASAAESTNFDGSSSDKAAASCYEIKQNNPDSKSGSYWLFTPQMDAPAQFYCDQETNGGGWVMIGRGREGWVEEYNGRGNNNDLVSNPDGTDAFSPVQLDSGTVDDLLGGQAPSDLEDGIRFKRATDNAGTQYQNAYAKRLNTESWSWALRANANWGDIRFDNPTSLGKGLSIASTVGKIGDWDNRYNALVFNASKATNWLHGFNYGYSVLGDTSPTSYLWSAQRNYAIPFTQVFVRPKLTQENAGFESIADSGAAQVQKRQLPNSFSAKMTWSTSVESGTGIDDEMNTRVQAITQVGNTVFTGGDFKNLVSASGEIVEQSYLAGYDVNSSELVRSFKPTFNGQIKALESLSNGKLAVGGEFTKVNDQDVAGFVVLDPVTGEIDKTYDWVVENRLTSGITTVKTIQEANGYLYIGGAFTHTKGHGSNVFSYARNAARFKMSDGSIDKVWRPEFNGTVNGISAGTDNENVYTAGYFSTNKGEKSWKLANLNTTDGKLKQGWDWKLSYTSERTATRMGFQFDVQDADSSVWTAGAEHLIAQYNKTDLSRMSSSITKSGGDFQDLYRDSANGVVYGACHCGDWVYEGGDMHDDPWKTSTDIHRIRLVGAFDEKTGEVIPDFSPNISGLRSYGVWESFVDSTGVLWVGGDITKTMGSSGTQNTVGFARYTPRDVTPAAAPKNLQVTSDGNKDQLKWTSGTWSPTSYQVLRDDRVVATVKSGTTNLELPHVDGARYFVRSVDQAGNFSASTPVATAPTGVKAEAPADAAKTDETDKVTDPQAPADPEIPAKEETNPDA